MTYQFEVGIGHVGKARSAFQERCQRHQKNDLRYEEHGRKRSDIDPPDGTDGDQRRESQIACGKSEQYCEPVLAILSHDPADQPANHKNSKSE